MLSNDIKDRIDRIWNTFWANGITNPLTVMEQITFLLFMKLLDDQQTIQEANANRLGIAVKNPIYSKADEALRWSRFNRKRELGAISSIVNMLAA